MGQACILTTRSTLWRLLTAARRRVAYLAVSVHSDRGFLIVIDANTPKPKGISGDSRCSSRFSAWLGHSKVTFC